MDDLFGIPAHPLVVHAAVVLLPLAAIGSIVVAAWPRSRRWYGPVVAGLAVVAMIAVVMAQQSGESLEERVDRTELVREHTSQGESVLPWAIAVAIVAVAVAIAAPLSRRLERVPQRAITAVLVVAALVAGIGATWTVVDVGHSGAKAAWHDVGNEDDDGGGNSGKGGDDDGG